jgi:hypothetical protein
MSRRKSCSEVDLDVPARTSTAANPVSTDGKRQEMATNCPVPLNGPAALDDADQNHDDRQNQQNVNESA